MITLFIQEKTMSTITELINNNQPVSIYSSADLFERTDVYEYLYPGQVGSFFIFLFGTFLCLILACAQTSYGANVPISLSFM